MSSTTIFLVILSAVIFMVLSLQANGYQQMLSPDPVPSVSSSPPSTQTAFAPPVKSLQELSYPNAQEVFINDHSAILESSDDPTTITSWYKDKIASQGMKVTSAVQTNTNSNILNHLTGTNGESEVGVDISKGSKEPKVTITINLNP